MKNSLLKLRHLLKSKYRFFRLLSITIIAFVLVLGIQTFSRKQAIATEPTPPTQLTCTNSPNLSLENLSAQGRQNYNSGRFDEALDCWQKAVIGYRKQGNEIETINNQINQAQAEQALGLLPRACSTLLQMYGEENCKLLLQDEVKRNKFRTELAERADSPSKIAGLRSLGNVLRGMGELNLSHEVLLLSWEKTQYPQSKASIWLDLGNTRRALSDKERALFLRSQEQQNLICAVINAYAATEAYKMAEAETNSTSPFNTKLQSQLNQLSLVLDLQDWHNKRFLKQTKQLFNQSSLFLLNKEKYCWEQLQLKEPNYKLTSEIRSWLLDEQLSTQNSLIQVAKIEYLQQALDKLPVNHTALFTKLNFAKNLIRIENIPLTKIQPFIKHIIEQAHSIGDSKIESYGYGYLGELYEKRQEFDLAQENTRKALFIAQSLDLASDTEYLWQWQLGRIYKSQIPPRRQAQTKEIKQESLIALNAAREMYQRTYLTLQSLRRELVTGNPDAQYSFQKDIESIYRDYVNLLLWDEKPSQEYLSKAREVIASLQAVELENFLRVACPEYNIERIDVIVDQKATNTAFIYPILLEDRIEVVVKLPNSTSFASKSSAKEELLHYSTSITSQSDFEEEVKQFQISLEEEYTFDDVRKEGKRLYDLLLKEAEILINKPGKNGNKIDTLVFALDTNLRNIPLAALVADDQTNPPTYLVDKYAVALAPRLEIPSPRIIQGKQLRVLAAGLTEPEADKYQAQFSEYLQKFGKLRFATKEIEEIEKIGKSQISLSKLFDKDFDTDKFQKKVNTSVFEILHLATHGEFSSSPEKTFILASNKPIAVNELENIFRKQAQNQPEPVELIVLSACETAAGDQRATLGISGVAVRAGARSAIASLWTLNDEISVEFTKKLYEQLLKPGLTKAQALQKAQQELKKSPGREHPRYWAPYILLGNWLQ